MTVWRMRIACCVTKATDKHLECVMLYASSPQQWLCEHALMLTLYVHWLSGLLHTVYSVLIALADQSMLCR
jgi:hypothetical protein